MSWTVLPDNWLLDPAVARLSAEARGILLSLAVWQNGQSTDTIPEEALAVLGSGIPIDTARSIIAAELVPLHLEPVDGGWAIVPRHPYVLPAAERQRRALDRQAFHEAGGRTRAETARRDERGRMLPAQQQPSGAAGDLSSSTSSSPAPSLPFPSLPVPALLDQHAGDDGTAGAAQEGAPPPVVPGHLAEAFAARQGDNGAPTKEEAATALLQFIEGMSPKERAIYERAMHRGGVGCREKRSDPRRP